jgi:hypothetical protein
MVFAIVPEREALIPINSYTLMTVFDEPNELTWMKRPVPYLPPSGCCACTRLFPGGTLL